MSSTETTSMDEWIPSAEWATIVEHVPIVSVDLVVLADGGVVLGKRENDPARGEWFVPGGRVRKHERLTDTVHRVADQELDVGVEIEKRLGTYEHFYETAEVPDVGGKHYVTNGFVVRTRGEMSGHDSQHGALRVFPEPPTDLHPYVEQYLGDAASLGYTVGRRN